MESGTQIAQLADTWSRLGRTDPFWSILAVPGTEGGHWSREHFYATGDREVMRILAAAERYGLPANRSAALDFGCGAGRLTQALCRHFERCAGVDVASSMIELAIEQNRFGARCRYVHNPTEHLGMYEANSVDFVCSLLVLQHIEPTLARGYIAEFLRLLVPAGLLVFQMPSRLKPQAVGEFLPTSCTEELPVEACRAEIQIARDELSLEPAEQLTLAVTVKNTSELRWPAKGRDDGWYQIKLGNHWLDKDGQVAVLDDSRAGLPHDVIPGAEVTLSLLVTAPSTPGDYVLELDMVQEMVAWFAGKGSHTYRVPVRVGSLTREQRSEFERRRAIAAIEMHCLPIQDVAKLVEYAGGTIVMVESDSTAGPEWLSYYYYVTK